MKKSFVSIVYTCIFLFCDFAIAEQLKVDFASNYPYKNLIDRTGGVKVFYTIKGEKLTCRVEVIFGDMKWASVDKRISKTFFDQNALTNCLSRESAEQILFQSYLQFGIGL